MIRRKPSHNHWLHFLNWLWNFPRWYLEDFLNWIYFYRKYKQAKTLQQFEEYRKIQEKNLEDIKNSIEKEELIAEITMLRTQLKDSNK